MKNSKIKCTARDLFLLSILTIIMMAGCRTQQGPDEIANIFIAAGEEALLARNGRAVRSLISDEYTDDNSRTAQDIRAIATGYIGRNQSIHIYSRLHSVTKQGNYIQATVLSAFAALPIENVSFLPEVNADIYWFDILLTNEDGTWRLLTASWRTAMVDDFLKTQ